LLVWRYLIVRPRASPAPPADADLARAETMIATAEESRPDAHLAFVGDKSFLFADSAFVMATLLMAVLGGVAGLRVLDLVAGQTLDLLSMIGFIMLLGMVINNAILLVAQTREAQAAGASLDEALKQALDQRLRPILIAALTGVLGALPMAINPGPGAVIYRGLAAVSVGGVALSLLFTVVLVPALLRLSQSRREAAMPAPLPVGPVVSAS
jgi:Cu/Ag efflux pump CusA